MTQYDPRVPSKSMIIRKNLHLLFTNPTNKDIFPDNSIIAADRKRRSIGSLYKPTVPVRSRVHGPCEQPGFFPCGRRCDTCRHSVLSVSVTSLWDGRVWRIRQHLTCTTPNVVYVIRCLIHDDELYVGSTVDLKARWRNHKSDVKLQKIHKCKVAEHVVRLPHPKDKDFNYLQIFAVEGNINKSRLCSRETYWGANLGTFIKGMNQRMDLPTAYLQRINYGRC